MQQRVAGAEEIAAATVIGCDAEKGKMADWTELSIDGQIPSGANAQAHNAVRLAFTGKQDFGGLSKQRDRGIKGRLCAYFQAHGARNRLADEKRADIRIVALGTQGKF